VCIAQSVIQLSISQIVLMNFIKISLIIKERPGEILIKLAIVLKTSKSSYFLKYMIWKTEAILPHL
jgi:hypothetical protein